MQENLKHEIALQQQYVKYCQSKAIPESVTERSWEFVKSQAFEDLDRIQWKVEASFSPAHRKTILDFCLRYQAIALAKLEAEEKAKEQLEEYLDSQRPWIAMCEVARDDFELEDALDAKPPGEVIITPDCIEVHALGWTDGFKNRLPRGGKYQGKGSGTWIYSLASRPQLEKLGLPILKYPGVE